MAQGYYGLGASICKINSNATLLKTFSCPPGFDEIWRIAFSECANQIIVAGGGPVSNNQTGFIDTNLINFIPIEFVPGANGRHDVALLALDNYGNCYEGTISHPDGTFSNQLVKLKLPSLLPVLFHVNAKYNFAEGQSFRYYNFGFSNGYNGIATSGKFVYSYDSYKLRKWSALTGQILTTKQISYPSGGDSSKIYWGGISADDCGNLFLADNNIVRQYDTTLTLVNSYTMPGIITDISLSNGKSVIFFSNSSLGAGVLAATTAHRNICYNNNDTTAIVHDIDLAILRNPIHPWFIDTTGANLPLGMIDFYGVIEHELGHAGLLYHVTNSGALMYYNIPSGYVQGAARKQISSDDKTGGLSVVDVSVSNTYYCNAIGPLIKLIPPGNCSFNDAIISLNPDVSNISVYPNPMDNQLTIAYQIKQNSNVVFSVTDVLGKLIYSANENQTVGTYEKKISLENILPGIYIITANTGSAVQSFKLVKVR